MSEKQHVNPYLEYSMIGFDIAKELKGLDRQVCEGAVDEKAYDEQLTELAGQSLAYMTEGMHRFGEDFGLDIEAETFTHALSSERRPDFALRFNELLYASISDPMRAIDAITDSRKLQQAIDLTVIADRINSGNFYERPNKVRAMGDATIGRAVLTMLSFNMDPGKLRIPVRN